MKNRFVFISPMYNASKTLEILLHSLYGQSYDNWKLILIDDMSSNSELLKCKEILQKFCYFGNKIELIINSEKCWEVKNVLKGISKCDDNDIICRIDADDWLTDLDALFIINEYYNNINCDVAWTAHRWGFSDKNISGIIPENVDVYKFPWVSSHLKTFRKYLINKINDINFRGENGEYIKRAGDQAIYLPILHLSTKKCYIPRVMYHYTINDVPATYNTEDAKFQKNEAEFLRNRGFVK